jgi:TolB-like protein/tRNA A-37 threonylcarbamoyl transferase component Bud32
MIGRNLLHYTITEQLGEGGMGIVYKARDRRLNRVVVIKMLRPDRVGDAEKKKRFIKEAQAASALNHPNIVTIHDIATADDAEFIVMEFVQGRALDCIIPDAGLDPDTAIKYGIQIANALEAAHASGIVHRDLKPGNIMVTPSELVKLLDFGLAKLTEPARRPLDATATADDHVVSTAEGALVGTLAYMSPEQAVADALDGRSDLFSFGAVMYEMLTGQRAFKGASAIATLCGVLREDPQPPSTFNNQIPAALDHLVMRCLQKRPEARYNTAREVRLELEAALQPRDRVKQGNSIAILPFANLTQNPHLDVVCDGFAKDIAGALTRIPTLRVKIPAAAGLPVVRPLHGPAVGQTLGTDLVLDGNVRGGGNRIRITVELVSVADGYHLWSERYDRDASDVFAMQDEICRDIVNRVRGYLNVPRPAAGGDAERFYTEGRIELERFTSKSLANAKALLEKAVMLKRDSAVIYAAIADYYVSAALLGARAASDAMPKAEWAARKSLSIDGDSEQSHALLGIVFGLHDYNWDESAASFERALRVNQGSPVVRQSHALWHLLPLGRIPEAVDEMERAVRAESASALRSSALGYLRYLSRDFDQAARLSSGALKENPQCWLAHWVLSWTLMAMRKNEQAVEHARHALTHERLSGWTKAVHAAATFAAGDPEPSRAALREMESSGETHDLAWAALIRMANNDVDQAFRTAARAIEHRNPMMPAVIRHPLFDPYRSDSRYAAVISRMRLAAAQRAY